MWCNFFPNQITIAFKSLIAMMPLRLGFMGHAVFKDLLVMLPLR